MEGRRPQVFVPFSWQPWFGVFSNTRAMGKIPKVLQSLFVADCISHSTPFWFGMFPHEFPMALLWTPGFWDDTQRGEDRSSGFLLRMGHLVERSKTWGPGSYGIFFTNIIQSLMYISVDWISGCGCGGCGGSRSRSRRFNHRTGTFWDVDPQKPGKTKLLSTMSWTQLMVSSEEFASHANSENSGGWSSFGWSFWWSNSHFLSFPKAI